MKRNLPGLSKKESLREELPAGEYLVEVLRGQYRWQNKRKSFLAVNFRVLQPEALAGAEIRSRLYCTTKELWKLSWFLTDFGYDTELFERDELNENRLAGLRGVVHIGYTNIPNRERVCDLEGFAPVARWSETVTHNHVSSSHREVA